MGNNCGCVNAKSSADKEIHFKEINDKDQEREHSIVKIQANIRGYQARRKCRTLTKDTAELTTTIGNNLRSPTSLITTPQYQQGVPTIIESNEHGENASVNKGSNKYFLAFNTTSKSEFLESMPETTNERVAKILETYGEFDYLKQEHKKFNEKFLRYPIFNPVRFEDGSIYHGQWKVDLKTYSPDSSKDLRKEFRHGKGKQIWPDGSLYDGFWLDGRAEGYGRLINADGYFYEGQWHNDKVHGKGKCMHPNGTTYEGDWVKDQQEGVGCEKYQDGTKYQGDYYRGKKNGKGVFSWPNGSKYEGDFKDNIIEGHGKYWTANDGGIYEGSWTDGKMNGKGIFTWSDGRRYEGHYRDNKKEGFGVYFMGDGRRYEGEWKDGVQHGKGVYINSGGKLRSGIWRDGKRAQWDHSMAPSANISQISDYQGL